MKKFLTLFIALTCFSAISRADSYIAGNSNPAWLAMVNDMTPVANLLIPGAHDAATGEGWVSTGGATTAKCQSKTVSELWDAGVRVFDIRPCIIRTRQGISTNYTYSLYCNHGSMQTNMTVQSFFETLNQKLEENPTEFAILHVLRVDSDYDNAQISK